MLSGLRRLHLERLRNSIPGVPATKCSLARNFSTSSSSSVSTDSTHKGGSDEKKYEEVNEWAFVFRNLRRALPILVPVVFVWEIYENRTVRDYMDKNYPQIMSVLRPLFLIESDFTNGYADAVRPSGSINVFIQLRDGSYDVVACSSDVTVDSILRGRDDVAHVIGFGLSNGDVPRSWKYSNLISSFDLNKILLPTANKSFLSENELNMRIKAYYNAMLDKVTLLEEEIASNQNAARIGSLRKDILSLEKDISALKLSLESFKHNYWVPPARVNIFSSLTNRLRTNGEMEQATDSENYTYPLHFDRSLYNAPPSRRLIMPDLEKNTVNNRLELCYLPKPSESFLESQVPKDPEIPKIALWDYIQEKLNPQPEVKESEMPPLEDVKS